jgi:Glycosyl transferases group 1
VKLAHVIVQGASLHDIAMWNVSPFRYERLRLLTRLGLRIRLAMCPTLPQIAALASATRADVLFIGTSWQESVADTERLFDELRRALRGRTKIVYLDGFDQTSSPLFSILPFVDLYVKKQLLRDRRRYLEDSPTGYVVADHAASTLGVDMSGWHFGSRVPSQEQLEKLFLGWNVGAAGHLRKRWRRLRWRPVRPMNRRRIDIHYRVSLAPEEDRGRFYNHHRRLLQERLAAVGGALRLVNVAGGGRRISRRQFRSELADSRMAVSAFGWGEVTDRDFEIALNRVCLVKPDMSHLETDPDIYVPGETYLPFTWDAADLADVLQRALADPPRLAAMADRAYRAYASWFAQGAFVRKIEAILSRLAV